jgi:acetyl-CoA carboxylase biotin carboxyl carrier protein
MLSEVVVPLSPEDVRALVAAFDGADWDEMTLTIDGTRLVLSRSGRPPSPADGAAQGAAPPAPAVGPHAAAAPPLGHATAAVPGASASSAAAAQPGPREAAAGQRVSAPSVGLFWRSPKPGAPPFVEVGDEVRPDDTVCIVEVMKLMNHVRAGVAGTVRAVHPENGQMVEHGDPLFTIEPAG